MNSFINFVAWGNLFHALIGFTYIFGAAVSPRIGIFILEEAIYCKCCSKIASWLFYFFSILTIFSKCMVALFAYIGVFSGLLIY